ncbi:alpha-1,2-fucosyltransferase [Bacteroidota bacterium]
MVIIGKKFGRLANRLWIFSYFAANSIAYGYKLLYRNFDEFIWYFNATRTNDFDGYPIKTRITRIIPLDYFLYWLMQAVIESIKNIKPIFSFYIIKKVERKGEGYDLNDSEFVNNAGKKLVITRDGGFYFRDNRNLKQYKEHILRFFSPREKHMARINTLIGEGRKKADIIVGVHIRKGDFAKWKNGRWYYENTTYATCMESLKQHLEEDGKRILFLIVSDEPVNQDDFQAFHTVLGTGHLIEDLYALASCDYIIGPPSTFTLWASFYGEKPLWFIEYPDQKPALSDFFVAEEIGQYTRIVDKI